MASDRTSASDAGQSGNGNAADVAPPVVSAGPYLRGGLAALSVGAAVIHFSVMFEHFSEYWAYGAFFLVSGWAKAVWAVAVCWRPSRWLLWGGAIGNALIVAVYVVTRTAGDVIGPGAGQAEAVGGVDVACTVFEAAIAAGALLLLLRRSGTEDRKVPARSARRLLAASAGGVLVATIAVSTPALAGPEGPDGMAGTGMGSSAPALAPTAEQISATATLLSQTKASLTRYQGIQTALAAGYRKSVVSGDLEYLFSGNGGFADLDPRHPSVLVYAVNLPGHATPVPLGAMYIAPPGMTGLMRIGGPLTPWETRDLDCVHGQVSVYDVPFYGQKCSSATWNPARVTVQILHVWTVPFPGGPFTGDISKTAVREAAQEALATG
ncbi:MAG: hypothetical protein J2P25_05640 [Nocardiopsaceae bacterium]|nr:hypothetical protein [Nocardiopsaceae bacterium]